MGRKSKNYTENYTELDGINNLVPKQQTIKLTEEEWSELNNGSKGSDATSSQTSILKFYKDLERYGIIKDSQFILNIPLELLREIFEQAKQLEKQHIIDAWHKGYDNQSPMIDEENCGQTYYTSTYGSKGSETKQ